MKRPNNIQFVLSAEKILSVNALYGAKLTYSGGRPIATMYKKGDAKQMEDYIKEQVRALDIKNNYPWVTKNTKFKFIFTVIFKSGFYRRDLDNCEKNLIDGIFRALEINDSHICEIHGYKTICPSIDKEKILVHLEEYTGEPRFDKLTEDLPVPEKIFLGGCSRKNEVIPGLEKLKFEYSEDKEECDCHFYILNPEISEYTIAEIINSTHEVKESSYGSMICGVLGKENDWGDRWKSISDIINLIKKLSSGSPRVIGEFIEEPSDILKYIGKPKRKRK